MQLNNVKGKYIAAIFQEGKKVIGHLPLRKSGMFAQTIFYFLKAAKENRWQITVHGRAINQNDGMGIKVPSQLLFTAEEKFNFQNSIFSKKHSLNYCNYIVKEPKTKKIKANHFLHLSNHPSDASKFSMVNSLAKYNAFSLINTPLTGTFLDISLFNHLSTTLLT